MNDRPRRPVAPPGVVVVDKPAGWTSHDVVARMRRLAGTRKVGHAGTLDPMATGVLVVGVDRATRLLGHLALAEKAYDATIRLGESTVTDDAEGEVTARADASAVPEEEVLAAVRALTGSIEQVPSAVSAVKVEGRRSYARVRQGESVQLAARPVEVSVFDVLDVRRGSGAVDVDARVVCSSGTYVRALARDLGAAVGVGGHLTRLRRTRVGGFDLVQAHTLETLERELTVVPLAEVARAGFSTFAASGEQAAWVRHGRALPETDLGAAGPVAVMAPEGEFLALYEQHGADAKAVAVFA
ncbi:MAG: tRNA pseudouridine(55) synthase TruB [Actinomycetota bacterium]|nr:tRNA pseudouridine(55) synthase TruB [Actinomycetota bacterium]